MKGIAALLAIAASAATTSAFYLPGVAPTEYSYQEQDGENIGQVLSGARVENSDYKMFMRHNEFCNVLCAKQWSAKDAELVADFINADYLVHLEMDNLPAVVRLFNQEDPSDVVFERGFPLGFAGPSESGDGVSHYLFNHLHFVVRYHDSPEFEGSRVVGLEVEPFSVKHKYVAEQWKEGVQLSTCNPAVHVDRNAEPMVIDGGAEVIFTYDVLWEASDTPWGQRWDVYLTATAGDADVHWFSIANSVIVVVFLSSLIITALVRALYRDIAQYNEQLTPEEQAEETGWKLVHGDVFRPPQGFFGPMFLSVFVGSGAQLVCTMFAVLLLAALGFLSPANRGALLTSLILIYMFLGAVAGYTSSRMYKTFRGKAWKRNTVLTAMSFPGMVFGVVLFLNFFVWGKGSSMAVPFLTLLTLLVLWFGVSTPLVFAGAYLGFRKDEMQQPCRTNQIARQVPEQPWYSMPVPCIAMGGLLPFGAIFVELFFIMSSIWQQHAYYVFGFLALVFLITLVTVAEISVVMTYFQLSAEDYNWWWRSFLTPASAAGYVFLYAVVFYFTRLEIEAGVATLMYFLYTAVACWGLFLLMGSVGFLSSLWFNRTIYAAIKSD